MGEITVSVDLPNDNDGFIEYECPNCQKVFRLDKNLFNEPREYSVLFCPYCGLNSSVDNFYTTECVEYMKIAAEQQAIDMLNDSFKSMEKQFRNSKFIKVKAKPIKKKENDILTLHGGIDRVMSCENCEENYKICNEEGAISYCPYCGEIK